MKYLSLFSGIGGFELGTQQAWKELHKINCPLKIGNELCSACQPPICIGYSEIDKYAIKIYKKHFPEHKNYGDITKLNPNILPNFELLVGGFPCQSFSVAGKRGGFNDTRGTLFFEICRIIKDKQPRLLLLENVKGLLSHDEGRTFFTIISTLDELGYDPQWQVLNSKNFGVPQNRERVFVIGHLRGTPRPEIFPIGERGEGTFKSIENKKPQANIARTVDTRTGSYPKFGQYVVPVLTPDRPNKRENGRKFKENAEPSFTLTSQDKHGIYDGVKIRRLTPTECERLQGFPDGWTDGVSDTQRYKTLGNAVTVNVIQAIMERL